MGGATTFPRVPEDLATDWLSDRVGGTISSFEVEQIGIGVGILGRLYRLSLCGDKVPASGIAQLPTLDEGARLKVVVAVRFDE